MEEEKEKNKEIELSEKDLDAIYFYLEMNFEGMTEEEKEFWTKILEKIDKNFYDD